MLQAFVDEFSVEDHALLPENRELQTCVSHEDTRFRMYKLSFNLDRTGSKSEMVTRYKQDGT